MAFQNITSANTIYMLSVATVFPVAQQLQSFAVNEAFNTEAVDLAEIQLGVDAKMAAGWVPYLIQQTISFLASSPSVTLFEQWQQAQDQALNAFPATGLITLPSLNRKYTLNNGVLTRFQPMSDVRRVLETRQFRITWEWPMQAAPA